MYLIAKYVFLYLWIIHINTVKGDNARCGYETTRHWITTFPLNVSYYTCNLDTQNLNYGADITKLDGQHDSERSDDDVEYFIPYQNSHLKRLTSVFCQKFRNLEAANIKDIEIEIIDEDALSKCKNLEHLALIKNNFNEIPEYLLSRNEALRTLLITHNENIQTLPENLFLNQNNLRYLALHSNHITSLPTGIFRSLSKLQRLELLENNLEAINPGWFENLQNLNFTSLSKNSIESVPNRAFAGAKNLKFLYIENNEITTLYSDSLEGLDNLQELSFWKNKIAELPIGVFRRLKNLKKLWLSYNMLTTIHSDSFGIHSSLTNLYLFDDNINAVDEKILNVVGSATLSFSPESCYEDVEGSNSPKVTLKTCFDNYEPRFEVKSIYRPDQLVISQSNEICGKPFDARGTIIGGTQIKRGDFPWIAVLTLKTGEFFCGGVIVGSQKVVTAAHCIQDKTLTEAKLARDFIILLGTHDLDNTFEGGRVIAVVRSIHMHPDWNPDTEDYDADIAVAVLDQPILFNKFIQPICLFQSGIQELPEEGLAVGYGRSEDTSKIHENIPKVLDIPIHTPAKCFLKFHILAKLSSERTFCGGSGRGVGVCGGDSGGGLYVKVNGAYYLRGIISASLINRTQGCDVDKYSIFTDALSFGDWINGIRV